jgi:hypothetical protein
MLRILPGCRQLLLVDTLWRKAAAKDDQDVVSGVMGALYCAGPGTMQRSTMGSTSTLDTCPTSLPLSATGFQIPTLRRKRSALWPGPCHCTTGFKVFVPTLPLARCQDCCLQCVLECRASLDTAFEPLAKPPSIKTYGPQREMLLALRDRRRVCLLARQQPQRNL